MAVHSLSIRNVLVIVVLIGFASGDELEEPIKLDGPMKITRRFGSVYGARDCGGASRALEIRHEGCVTGLPALCTVPVDKATKTEIVFIPRENIDDLVARITIIREDGESKKIQNEDLSESSVTAGREYFFKINAMATSELKGKIFRKRIEIFRDNDRKVIMCAEADFVAY